MPLPRLGLIKLFEDHYTQPFSFPGIRSRFSLRRYRDGHRFYRRFRHWPRIDPLVRRSLLRKSGSLKYDTPYYIQIDPSIRSLLNKSG